MRAHNTVLLDFLRHGEPQGGQRLRGCLDDPLSAQGWAAMHNTLSDYRNWHHIHHSPLRRCAEFAEELHRKSGIPLSAHDDLREIGFGDWEGRTTSEVLAEDEHALGRYWDEDDEFTPPGAEAVRPFLVRVRHCIAQIVRGAGDEAGGASDGADGAEPGDGAGDDGVRRLLIISHGGVMRAALSFLLGLPFKNSMRIAIPYACLSRIAVYLDGDGTIQGAALQAHALWL